MASLIVVAHPDRDSLTQHVARAAADAIRAAGGEVELADLVAENFDPLFTDADLGYYRGAGEVPRDVVAEQERVDRADRLILVFPMYWWSMPALLKGWIDRVFTGGWAYDASPDAAQFGLLERLTVDLIIVAGDDVESFERHGIREAVRIQIERGIIEYSGAIHGATDYIFESDTQDAGILAAELREVSARVATRAAVVVAPS